MKKIPNNLIVAIAMIVLGVMFIILKTEVVSIAMTVLGVALIIAAIIDFVNKNLVEGVVKAVLGVAVLVCGWALVSVALYILAVVLLIYGILQLIEAIKTSKRKEKIWAKVLRFVEPIVTIIIAACLLFNQGGTISWLFIVTGVFFIIEGAIALVNYLKASSK